MIDDELKNLISDSTDVIAQLNKVEQETIREKIGFISWIIGFVSVGFILYVTSIENVKGLAPNFNIYVPTLFVMICFSLNIMLGILYRLIAYKIIGRYHMSINYLNIQEYLLVENLDLIPREDKESNVVGLTLYGKLNDYDYMDISTKNKFLKKTNKKNLSLMNSIVFYFIVISFISEYAGIFYVFSRIINIFEYSCSINSP